MIFVVALKREQVENNHNRYCNNYYCLFYDIN